MRILVTAAALAGTIAAVACLDSDTPSSPSRPRSAVAAAAIDCIGVDQNLDQTAYSEKRVFLEAQGWWGEPGADGSIPRFGDAEHIHAGMCFPLQQAVSGSLPFRVIVIGHNLRVGSQILSTNLHDPGGGSFAKIAWNTPVTSSPGNITLTRSVTVNTAAVASGKREFRILTKVKRQDGTELHVSSGWCWTTANGGASGNSGTCGSTYWTTMGRGWYNCFEYKIAEVRNWTYPYGGISADADYPVSIGARDGAGPLGNTTLTGWTVRVNPNFHAGDGGRVLGSGTQRALGNSMTIPNDELNSGEVEKLVVVGSAQGTCSAPGVAGRTGEVSAVQVIPIKVN